MTRILLWDEAPGEIRAGISENGNLVELRILRPQVSSVSPGTHYTARIKQIIGSGKALVDLGRDGDAQLEFARSMPEGAILAVEIVRSAIPEPGRWKLPLARLAMEFVPQANLGPHGEDSAVARFLKQMAVSADEVVCARPQTAVEVKTILADAVESSVRPELFDAADFDSVIEQAVSGEFPIAGGMLSIERSRAMTLIDIDGSGDPMQLNLAASREIPKLLRLLDIGGQVGIDFLALPDKKARQMLDAALAQECSVLGPHERTAANGFGFVQIVRPRPGPSIPEIVSGTMPGRLSLESRAIALLRAAARSTGFGMRRLVAPPAVIEKLREWPDELDRLRRLLGAEIVTVPDSSASGYGHVHVHQS